MEWYFENEIDDLVVPNDEELLDRHPSSDSWSQWGCTAFGSFDSSKKHLITGGNISWEELDFCGRSFTNELDIIFSEQSSESRMCQGLSGGSLVHPHEKADYQLNVPTEIDQMSSLLEEDATDPDYMYGSFDFSSKLHDSMMPDDTLLTDMTLESQHSSSYTYGKGTSKYMKTHAFSPSASWENKEVATSGPSLQVKNLFITCEQHSESGQLVEETSMEEYALQELERATSQLTKKTRMCFRDALYRLAENSKQDSVMRGQNEQSLSVFHDEAFRSEKEATTESKTNVIDRAIANLMFNKMDFNALHVPAAASLNLKQDAVETAGQFNYSLNQLHIPCCSHLKILAGDREVPNFGPENPSPITTKLHTDFSSRAASMIQSR